VPKEQCLDLEEQLRQAITKTGLSLHEIGRRSGVAAPIVSRFMRADRSLTLPVVARLCRALGLRLCAAAETAPAPKKGKGK
jgi:transcriptional regulator with XRE-family HTH domain